MTFKLPYSNKNMNLGLPDQGKYDAIIICKWCGTACEDVEKCPKCKRKVTLDQLEPRRGKDAVDFMSKARIESPGLDLTHFLELMNNGDCGEM
jgi:hypothetical protein